MDAATPHAPEPVRHVEQARHARAAPHDLRDSRVSTLAREAAAIAPATRVASPERRFRLPGASPLRLGLRFSPMLRFDEWVDVGRRVGVHADASLWWLGDWLAYGKRRYGKSYKRGIELTGLEYQTLRNYATVARRFELSRRRDTLSFHHHAEVCALPDDEQDRWLDRAEAEGWSRNELRRRLRRAASAAAVTSLALRLTVAPDRHARWQDAARASGIDLESWIVRTLDAAVDAVSRV